jgi:hypothetical protein
VFYAAAGIEAATGSPGCNCFFAIGLMMILDKSETIKPAMMILVANRYKGCSEGT